MVQARVVDALFTLGWPRRFLLSDDEVHRAVADFQRGYALDSLLVDGYAGPKTLAALKNALDHGGRCSDHFTFAEFASKGNGYIRLNAVLVDGLERYRAHVDRPVPIVSGYRDPAYNEHVGGAGNSQHLYGNAADLVPALSVSRVKALSLFSGIGYQKATGLVRHVDVRHTGPQTTGGTPARPTVWVYE